MAGIDSYVKLMLHMDGDLSPNHHTVSCVSTVFDGSFKKIGGSSLFFNSSSYVLAPDHDDFHLANNDFTMECWIRVTTLPTTESYAIVSKYNTAQNQRAWGLFLRNNGGTYELQFTGCADVLGNTLQAVFQAITLSQNTWTHIVCQRNGNYIYFYQDGVAVGSGQSFTTDIVNASEALIIGARETGGPRFFKGNIDGIRINNGNALYSSTFTPPTSRLTPVSGDVFVYNCEADAFGGNDLTVNGSTQIRTISGSFDQAMYFDGIDGYLTVPDSDGWNFGSSDFTVDFWVNFESTTNTDYPGFFQQREDANNLQKFMYYRTDGELYYSVRVGGTAYTFFSGDHTFEPDVDTWYHIALVLVDTTAYFYVDGVLVGDDSEPTYTVVNYNGVLDIGRITSNDGTINYPLNGYIDEFRISKGIARWTSNFTPPTSAYSEIRKFISGSLNDAARVLIFDESDWSLVSNSLESAGDYVIDVDDAVSTITVAARSADGEIIGYQNVVPSQE